MKFRLKPMLGLNSFCNATSHYGTRTGTEDPQRPVRDSESWRSRSFPAPCRVGGRILRPITSSRPGAKLVELGRGFGLTEGGLWIAEGTSGYWIFAGLLDNVLYKVTPQKQVSVFMEKAGIAATILSMSARRLDPAGIMCF